MKHSAPEDCFVDRLFEGLCSVSADKAEKARFDRSFRAVILGVDRKFTDTVSEGDRSDIVEKFGIPETTENGESKYYTFRIDGAYYVKRSAFPFKLYDEIKVRVPNGSWSDMFIENGVKDDAFVPEVIYSQAEPTTEEYTLRVGDIWIKTDENGSLVSVYEYRTAESGDEDEETLYEWQPKTSVPAVIYSAAEPAAETHSLKAGDIWIEINSENDKKARAVYEYVISDETAEEPVYIWQTRAAIPSGGGVGENIGAHNERFNDYSGSGFSGSGDYNHIEGAGNSLSNASYTSVGGNSNTVSGSLASGTVLSVSSLISGTGNTAEAKTDNQGNVQNSLVTGYHNETAAAHDEYDRDVGGRSPGIKNSLIAGENNEIFRATDSAAAGNGNYINAENSIICGVNHNASQTDDYTGKEYTLIDCIMCGQENIGLNDGIVCGQGNTGKSKYYLNVGIKTAVSGRRDGLGADSNGNLDVYGTINQQNADYAECFEWLDGNPENEDRRGMLVALDGDKIIPANGSDIFGVISAAPTVCANSAPMEWQGRFKRDVFGAIIYDNKNAPVLNPDYDEGQEYIPRSERKEWAAVGVVGRLVVCDDGSCKPGEYCKALNGIAVGSEEKTNVRALKRVDETHVEIFIK